MQTLYGALLAFLLMVPALSWAADPAVPAAPTPAAAATSTPRKLDLNRATLPEFVGVPGIGPRMAQEIVDLRLSKGKFTKIEDLLEIKGIGPKKLAALGSYLVVSQTAAPAPPGPGSQPK